MTAKTPRLMTAACSLGAVLALSLAGCAGNVESADGPSVPATTAAPATSAPTAPETTSATGATSQSAAAPSFTFNVPPPAEQRPDNPVEHPMTPTWEQQTLEQISAFTGVPANEYAGLDPDKTFIATNNTGFTYWVGTAALPGESAAAKQSVEGAGSYFLIHYDQEKNVDVFPVGKAGYGEPNRCAAAKLPDSIRQLWGWQPTDCPPF